MPFIRLKQFSSIPSLFYSCLINWNNLSGKQLGDTCQEISKFKSFDLVFLLILIYLREQSDVNKSFMYKDIRMEANWLHCLTELSRTCNVSAGEHHVGITDYRRVTLRLFPSPYTDTLPQPFTIEYFFPDF